MNYGIDREFSERATRTYTRTEKFKYTSIHAQN